MSSSRRDTLDELRALSRRIAQKQLEPDDWAVISGLVSKQIARTEAQLDRVLAKMAAKATADTLTSPAAAEATGAESPTSEPPEPTAADNAERAGPPSEAEGTAGRKRPKRGHGRNGARAYRSAPHHRHALAAGVLRGLCSACRRCKLSPYRDKRVVRLFGQPLFGAEVHQYEQARCRGCRKLVSASGPPDVDQGMGSGYIRYDHSAAAMLMVMHYFAGAPFKRLESLHAGWGIPFSDANQWQLVNEADDRLLPLYKALEKHAIQKATSFRIDDTGSKVITLQKQIAAEISALAALGESVRDVRTGINATGSYWETPSGPVILFYTGRHHAGEIVDQLLRTRPRADVKLVKCTDGASKNFDHGCGDMLTEATCNAHALLKFRAIKDQHPAEYAAAGSVYKRVFDNDDEAERLGLSPEGRRLHHQQHSWPLMLELKALCEAKLQSRTVEPNSPLWEPLNFVLNQWDRLTRFCHVENVPLDTNRVEQALIMPVRYLAGSFNYHTQDGAMVGDHAMSLIATARANHIEPVAYLTECLRCHADLAKRPEYYLPWSYRQRLQAHTPGGPSPGDGDTAHVLAAAA